MFSSLRHPRRSLHNPRATDERSGIATFSAHRLGSFITNLNKGLTVSKPGIFQRILLSGLSLHLCVHLCALLTGCQPKQTTSLNAVTLGTAITAVDLSSPTQPEASVEQV